MTRGRRKAEDPATARRILAAAEQHFAARGLAGARTEEIAAAAHANKAMLYYYFGNKRRLHRAVLANLFRQLRARVMHPPVKNLPAKEQYFRYVTGYFDFLATHPNYPRLVQREAMEASAKFDSIVREHFRPLHRLLARVVQEAIQAGEIRDVDADQIAFITLGMVTSYFAGAPIMSRVTGRDLLSAEAIEERRRALLDFLSHGLARERSRGR
ncbi:MAG: CerR family C-terminal domain-containing protein [Acidobacteriota bacterium]|nr:CerR family C-terminal domain-containing protein [Acidobacteriota bacterium]MDE3169307.1 CerR family C-terminal domain-containing protein [Acidobacteriota bacterium]